MRKIIVKMTTAACAVVFALCLASCSQASTQQSDSQGSDSTQAQSGDTTGGDVADATEVGTGSSTITFTNEMGQITAIGVAPQCDADTAIETEDVSIAKGETVAYSFDVSGVDIDIAVVCDGTEYRLRQLNLGNLKIAKGMQFCLTDEGVAYLTYNDLYGAEQSTLEAAQQLADEEAAAKAAEEEAAKKAAEEEAAKQKEAEEQAQATEDSGTYDYDDEDDSSYSGEGSTEGCLNI